MPASETNDSRPRFAYLLLTHKQPEYTEDLVTRILDLSPQAQVIVHHDLCSSEPLPWAGRPPERVYLAERSQILWGDWSMVEVTLRLMRQAIDELDADWMVIISGEHRPVTDLPEWEARTSTSGVDALIEAKPLHSRLHFGRHDRDGNRFLARCLFKWRAVANPSFHPAHRAMCAFYKLSLFTYPVLAIEFNHRRNAWFIGVPRKRIPANGWTFYKGSQWIAFNAKSAEVILDTDPKIKEWFSLGHIADETYCQTILRNTPELVVTDTVVTFVPDEPIGVVHPDWMLLTPDQLPSVWSSGAAFARKVDPLTRAEVISALDAEVDRRRRGPMDPSLTPLASGI
jgi:hypothetical protein